ncbi:pzg [Drosophila busckii]|uniref:Pzg n=1 Tax=Drosophila busckii TaxID=30019 RepID=A0A0M4F0D2_DROBS|nr:zinc finger protein 37 [Drosophila busckii]ALC44195.1 pzg [Drosophila busckii]
MTNQLNPATYRKFNNLLSSGAVTVTGPGQPRVLKTTRLASAGGGSSVAAVSQQQLDSDAGARCYICDELLQLNQTQTSLTEMCTTHTSTKFPNKLAQLVGEGFLVIVCNEDFVCSRCTNLVNYYDRLENDVERVKSNLLNLLNKKYGINEDSGGNVAEAAGSPPLKMQKMQGGAASRSLEDSSSGNELLRTRKVVQQSTPVSQQLKLASTTPQTQVQRKATKIYKCTSCDYKTSDMRLFNTHYETCKQQTFQCKTCRKIFPHFGAMKQHMVRDHSTAMDNTCAMCHINFVNEASLRKHMESNHATNVLVTSTTTIPAAAAQVTAAAVAATTAAAAESIAGSALYTCNHCQFKSTDKGVFDDHMRKHSTGKPKPFKCRLCSQRFETREAATVHAKQHQTNYFKCSQCSLTFSKRELLVKHAEMHQQSAEKHSTTGGAASNTQKLLQETIDEALSDSVPAQAGATVVAGAAEAENNIRFFSCSICSLTFIQETYYNHHMETHRRDKKSVAAAGGTTALNSAATALLSDEPNDGGVGMKDETGEQNAEADIESLFEKLHSEKSEGEKIAGKNEMVITSQDGTGGITFNITIPQMEATGEQAEKDSPNSQTPVSVSIDMPNLDQAEEDESQSQGSSDSKPTEADNKSNAPVSMPSLDDDNEATANSTVDSVDSKPASGKSSDKAGSKTESAAGKDKHKESAEESAEAQAEKREAADTPNTEQSAESAAAAEASESEAATAAEAEAAEAAGGEQHVAMELDEAMQAQVDGGQIKFIVNENGHLLQLDNHILTDAEGNQIIVQDPEQIQQLLQSVGVLQSGEGLEGETLQMMTDGNGQMVLVHGDNNEQQLIDASLLNSEGQLIIQQGQDGEEGPHVISEDGTRIPVSVSYTEDGQPIVQVQQQVLEQAQSNEEEKEDSAAAGEEAAEATQTSEAETATTTAAASVATTTATSSAGSSASFYALEEFAETKTD